MTQKSSQSESSNFSESKSGTSQSGASADPSVDHLKEGVLGGARSLGAEVQHMASDVAGGAKKAAETKIGAGKDFAVEHLGSVADALRKTSHELRSSESGVTDYVDMAASSVEKVSKYLQTRTLNQLLGDVEGYARREPAVFLGAAFFTGLLGGRFLKSATPAPAQDTSSARGQQQGAGSQSYRALPQHSGQGATQRQPQGQRSGGTEGRSGAGETSSRPASSRSETSSPAGRSSTESFASSGKAPSNPNPSSGFQTGTSQPAKPGSSGSNAYSSGGSQPSTTKSETDSKDPSRASKGSGVS